MLSLSLLLCLLDFAVAARISVTAHPKYYGATHILPRANVSAGINLTNSQNLFYIGQITLNSAPFNVILDTGSSDLWVAGNVPNSKDLGKSTTLSYAIGEAKGNINTAMLGFDDFTVQNQAFVLVKDTSGFTTNINNEDYRGFIGLGPDTGSVVRKDLDGDQGTSPLFNIFQQNMTSQNFISILLDRQGDPDEKLTGQFTISEVIPGFENITSQPKLTIKGVPSLTDVDQHWSVLTDEDGVIGPDGQPIEIKSIVPHVPDKRLVAVIDSGFTFPQVPRQMTDAIYGRVRGAQYDTQSETWLVPCTQELNITFKFGGVSFPIHPLDTVSSDLSPGGGLCIGSFQPITSAFSLLGEYDMILGMTFLRNAYALIDFGNFVDGSTDQEDPFVQMLSLTDPTQAHKDFVSVRLKGADTTASQTLLPASQESHSPESEAERRQHEEGAVLRHWPYILLGCLIALALTVGCCVWAFCRRCTRRKRARAAGLGTNGGGPFRNPYQTLSESTPPPVQMHTYGSQSAF